MNRELSPTAMSELRALPSNSKYMCAENDLLFDSNLYATRAKFSTNSSTQYLWLIKGSQLDVMSSETKRISQRLLASFDFANIFNDNSIRISNVAHLMDKFETNLANRYTYILVVSLRRNTIGSLLCVIDVRLSVVLKTIECPFSITSLEVISTNSLNNTHWPLINEMLFMSGIVAIGTLAGHVFILDLFLDNERPFADSLIPIKISFITSNSSHVDIKSKRKTALLHDQIICLPLNGDAHHKNKFIYRSDDGKAISSYPSNDVYVSAVYFIPQTALLCIGFNFGGFQLYNLTTFKLECSCGLEYGLSPVVSFNFQDPENDPKNYCYMWLIRGQEIEDNTNTDIQSPLYFNMCTTAFMYSLCFGDKQWIDDYGILYNGFIGCTCRFEFAFATNPYNADASLSCSSRLIDCYTIPQGNLLSHKTSDEESVNLDLSLCFLAWEALAEGSDTSSTYFAVFDLNQWYRSQMPSRISADENDTRFSPFIGIFSLIDIANVFAPDAILAVQLNSETLTKFRPESFQSEIHYYPSSLSFQVSILSESQICTASFLGLPKRVLSQLTSIGSDILIDPKEYLNHCFISGLLLYDISSTSLSISSQRETILTIALENNLISFLTQLISDWSSGELSHVGCDCKFILEWIWKRVAIIKNNIDSITLPLFDYCGQQLDKFKLSQLYSFESDIKSLNILLRELKIRGSPTTEQGIRELDLRREVTELIGLYLRILLWLYDCNLLPEYSEEDAYGENEVAFPASKFSQYYKQRRLVLHQINTNLIQPTDLLLIDGLVNWLNPNLSNVWKSGGGNGLYPPPNLHSLISIFLFESVSEIHKQAIMLYSCFDLANFLSDRQSDIAEKIRLFPSAFGLKPGLTKLIQGMWSLDHQVFDFALSVLLDPSVKPILFGDFDENLSKNLQLRIVTSFFYQNEARSALIYSQNCSQFDFNTSMREKLHISMLLANQHISRAFEYQRLCRTETDSYEILFHFYLVCDHMSMFERVFKLPLDELEEEVLTSYLLASQSPNAKQLILLYYIVNNKIIDAVNILNNFKEELSNVSDKDLAIKTEQLVSLINSYANALPLSLLKLGQEIANIEAKKLKEKPKFGNIETLPIKVNVSSSPIKWIAPSQAIEDVLQQIDHIWRKEQTINSATSTPVQRKHSETVKKNVILSRNSPFLRTPINDKRNKKIKHLANETINLIDFNDTQFLNKSKPYVERMEQTITDINNKSIATSNNDQDLLIILKTPQINRKSVGRVKSNFEINSMNDTNYFTPTSILKVKQMMRRSTSPSSLASSPTASSLRSKEQYSTPTTPVQHKLRFSVPDPIQEKDIPYTSSEDSVENARFNTLRDTLMLKPLKAHAQQESVSDLNISPRKNLTTLIEVIEDNISVSTPIFSESISNPSLNKDEENIQPLFVFSPPNTRSSAKKKQIEKSSPVKCEELDSSARREISFLFSPPNTRSRIKKSQNEEQIGELMDFSSTTIVETLDIAFGTPEKTSRSTTPVSAFDDSASDSHKSDTSQKSKVSTRSSRSSRTPTKKNPNPRRSETPTHSMKLRASTKKKTPKKKEKN